MILNIIIDTSGSMADMVKSKIGRITLDSLVSYTRHFRQDTQLRVFLWNDTFRKVDVDVEIQPGGKALFTPLAEYFCSIKNAKSQNNAEGWLLLSDGCWDLTELEGFIKDTAESLPKISGLAIGADADFFKLEKIAGKGNVFLSEDVFEAFESC